MLLLLLPEAAGGTPPPEERRGRERGRRGLYCWTITRKYSLVLERYILLRSLHRDG